MRHQKAESQAAGGMALAGAEILRTTCTSNARLFARVKGRQSGDGGRNDKMRALLRVGAPGRYLAVAHGERAKTYGVGAIFRAAAAWRR